MKLKNIFLLLVIAVIITWTAGVFDFDKIWPGRSADKTKKANLSYAPVKTLQVPIIFSAVGTIQSKKDITVSSQTTGQVLNILVDAGDRVKKGQLIAELDDRELQAKFAQIASEFKRIKKFYSKGAASKAEYERVLSQYEQTKIALSYTKIKSPINGLVSSKLIELGDLAWPGKPLFKIYDPLELRVEASIREGLISYVKTGEKYPIYIPTLDLKREGIVEQIIPSADPASRTFTIRASLNSGENIYPGMFAKLLIKTGTRQAIAVPKEAVERVGQLEYVYLFTSNAPLKLLVKTGKDLGKGLIEVLSGLSGGEAVVIKKTNIGKF